MASHVDKDTNKQKITFLYLLKDGASPKSYGINVAHLAKIPNEVIQSASQITNKFELSLLKRSILAETKSLSLAMNTDGGATVDGVVSAKDESNACLLNLWKRAKEVLSE